MASAADTTPDRRASGTNEAGLLDAQASSIERSLQTSDAEGREAYQQAVSTSLEDVLNVGPILHLRATHEGQVAILLGHTEVSAPSQQLSLLKAASLQTRPLELRLEAGRRYIFWKEAQAKSASTVSGSGGLEKDEEPKGACELAISRVWLSPTAPSPHTLAVNDGTVDQPVHQAFRCTRVKFLEHGLSLTRVPTTWLKKQGADDIIMTPDDRAEPVPLALPGSVAYLFVASHALAFIMLSSLK